MLARRWETRVDFPEPEGAEMMKMEFIYEGWGRDFTAETQRRKVKRREYGDSKVSFFEDRGIFKFGQRFIASFILLYALPGVSASLR